MSNARTLLPLLLCCLLLLAGCGQDGASRAAEAAAALPVTADEPIGVQMMRAAPHLKTQRFSTLVNFEAPGDAVFFTSAPAGTTVALDSTRAHTGRASLKSDAKSVTVKLASLAPAKSFPGKWAVLGAYVYAPAGARLTLACETGSGPAARRKVNVPAGQWTPAMIDLETTSAGSAAPSFVIDVDSAGPVWIDDLMLIDTAHTLFGADEPDGSLGGPWSIRRRGLYYVVAAPGRFTTKLLTAECGGPIGWQAEETGAARARFASSGGAQKSVTIYPDGRSYWDGVYRPLSAGVADAAYGRQHASPARVSVPEELGRVDRDTPGDADNDGYNESRGAYAIRASGPRVELTLAPRTPQLTRPVIEIAGMPTADKVVATIEGRLIEDVTRLEDGRLLIDIPARLNRPTVITVKAQ